MKHSWVDLYIMSKVSVDTSLYESRSQHAVQRNLESHRKGTFEIYQCICVASSPQGYLEEKNTMAVAGDLHPNSWPWHLHSIAVATTAEVLYSPGHDYAIAPSRDLSCLVIGIGNTDAHASLGA